MSFALKQLCAILHTPESAVSNFRLHNEASDYMGCEFRYKQKNYIFRKAKVTPKKSGLFVTLWKRSASSVTEPFKISDEFDALLIFCSESSKQGFLNFHKNTLAHHKILSDTKNSSKGKRGFRVYPDWTIPTSDQARRTQQWQTECFSIGTPF